MKKKIVMMLCCILLTVSGCGSEVKVENGLQKEPISGTDTESTASGEEGASEEQADNKSAEEKAAGEQTGDKSAAEKAAGEQTDNKSADKITNEQALEAIKSYCYANNPDLEKMADSEDVTVYFDVSSSEAGEIIVLYRSYTGAQIRYYIDPSSGEVYVTEQVPGIIDEEQRTDETFNIRDYMNKAEESAKVPANGTKAARKDGERFEDVIILEGM
ncbi:MAG: hypothetical protein K6E91_03810 [Butyrivibrio sp.]|nr:hypothetical protein [Butyrivibrio sp.]